MYGIAFVLERRPPPAETFRRGSTLEQNTVYSSLSGACCEALCCRVRRGVLAVGALDTCVHFLSSVTNSSLKGCRPSLPLGR